MKAVGYLGKNLEPWSATFMPCKMLLRGESSKFYWTDWLLLHSWSPSFKFIERAGFKAKYIILCFGDSYRAFSRDIMAAMLVYSQQKNFDSFFC